MIIIKVGGGLGNQMFAYAVARGIALANNTDAKLDLYQYTADGFDTIYWEGISELISHAKYNLDKFNIKAKKANHIEIYNLKFSFNKSKLPLYKRIYYRGLLLLIKILNYLSNLIKIDRNLYISNASYYISHNNSFDANLLQLKQNLYLEGVFFHYKYFNQYKKFILEELTLKNPLSDKNQKIANTIKSCNAVSIHFRRGDFIKIPEIKNNIFDKIHTDTYYNAAINYIIQNVPDPYFFIFSDEIEWVKQNQQFIPNIKVMYIENDNNHLASMPYEDLMLMSLCKHNIIAGGSTFSWWGAYLNQNPGKIVMRAKNLPGFPVSVKDYFPPEWVAIES